MQIKRLKILGKSSRPDGFPIILYQRFWDLVNSDILLLFNQFYNVAMDLRCLNYALVALIPKKEGASMVNEFRLLACSMASLRSSPRFSLIGYIHISIYLWTKSNRSSLRIDIFLKVWLVLKRSF